MAKLTKSYENGIEKLELTFRGKNFDFSMIPDRYGRTGDKPDFDYQVPTSFQDLVNDDDLTELLGELSYTDDGEELADKVQQLARWEVHGNE